jgi:RNA polymerase sigma-70 factor (ECF subfamily)
MEFDSTIHTETIIRAIGGDIDAESELFRLYANTIVFHVSNLVDDVQDREDVFQEVALAVHRSISKLKSPYAFSAWLNKLIVNVCYKFNTKNSRRKSFAAPIEQAEYIAETNEDSLPDVSAEKHEMSEVMYDILQKLPDSQREAVFLYYFDGLKYREIGKLLGITKSTVATNILKGKKNIIKMMEEAGLDNMLIEKEKDKKMEGTPLGAMIASGFEYGINHTVVQADANTFVNVASNAASNVISSHTPIAGIGKALIAKSWVSVVAASVAGACVLGVTGVVIFHQPPAPAPEPAVQPPAVTEPAAFIPDTHISMTSADFPQNTEYSNVNPESIELKFNSEPDSAVEAWSIAGNDGAVVGSGTGTIATTDGLANGEYRITFKITNESGATATAARTFYIYE